MKFWKVIAKYSMLFCEVMRSFKVRLKFRLNSKTKLHKELNWNAGLRGFRIGIFFAKGSS